MHEDVFVQVDVIESQFSLLLIKLNKTKDFDAICVAHEAFLTTLANQCFLHMKVVSTVYP